MGFVVYLRSANGQQVRGLADPNGGRFDAAGDFDRAIGRLDASFPRLLSVDPYRITVFPRDELPDLRDEIGRALRSDLKPIEKRGLRRLDELASRALDDPTLDVVFVGD